MGINAFDFFAFRTDKGLARRVWKRLKRVEFMLVTMQHMEKALELAEQAGKAEDTKKDFEGMIKSIKKMLKWITQAGKSEEILDWREDQEMQKVERALERLHKKYPADVVIDEAFTKAKKLADKRHGLEEKERVEMHNAVQEITRFVKYITTVQDRRLAINIKKEAWDEIEKAREMQNLYKHLLEMANKFEKVEKDEDVQKLHNQIRQESEKLFSDFEAAGFNIYNIVHYEVILIHHLSDKVDDLYKELEKIVRMSFPKEKAAQLKIELDKLKVERDEYIQSLAAMSDYIYTHGIKA